MQLEGQQMTATDYVGGVSLIIATEPSMTSKYMKSDDAQQQQFRAREYIGLTYIPTQEQSSKPTSKVKNPFDNNALESSCFPLDSVESC